MDAKSYEMPPIFPLIQREGRVEWKEMFSTYNCGIGLVAAVREEDCDRLIREAGDAGERAFVIGRVKAGERRAEVLF